jgi:magnesium transporter
MFDIFKNSTKKIGMPRGTLIHVGEKKVDRVRLSIIDYKKESLESKELHIVQEALPFKESPSISWLNISGLHDMNILKKIGAVFDIHNLVLEDIVNTTQRPKVEIYDDHIFIVIKMITFDSAERKIDVEQISFIVGDNYVITFQERVGDIFNPVRERINNAKSRLRNHGTDYLMYALLDVIVDNYYLILEQITDIIEELEEKILDNPNTSLPYEIQKIKKEILFLRKSLLPIREAVDDLVNEDTPLITDYVAPYLKDLYDHTIQVVDTVDSYRDMVTTLLEIYHSTLSNRMNDVMKVLTIIATIFIPLTFIAGIYGMNFENMPELK